MPKYGKGKPMPMQAKAFLAKFLSLDSRHAAKAKLGVKGAQSTGSIHSIRTFNTYRQSLGRAGNWVREVYGIKHISSITPEQATAYLEYRAESSLGQKTLNTDRIALEYVTGKGSLSHVKSTLNSKRLVGRAYTADQVREIASHQGPRNAISTWIAYASGIRAHELATLRPSSDGSAAGHRKWRQDLFEGRDGVRYLVTGKGGLTREVLVPRRLSDELESRLFSSPVTVQDRGVNYQQRYDIGFGNSWSRSVTDASIRALGRSTGAHGLRHSYAQERVAELQNEGYGYKDAKTIVSQELGHFREDVTMVYLR